MGSGTMKSLFRQVSSTVDAWSLFKYLDPLGWEYFDSSVSAWTPTVRRRMARHLQNETNNFHVFTYCWGPGSGKSKSRTWLFIWVRLECRSLHEGCRCLLVYCSDVGQHHCCIVHRPPSLSERDRGHCAALAPAQKKLFDTMDTWSGNETSGFDSAACRASIRTHLYPKGPKYPNMEYIWFLY